jgi:hypothetical protein
VLMIISGVPIIGNIDIVLDFFVGGRSCGSKRCVRENIVSRARDPVHGGDKALTRETPVQRGAVFQIVFLKFYL